MSNIHAPPSGTRGTVAIVAASVFLIGVVAYQFWGVVEDTAQALRYRFGLDYGEGIVWQQVLLMFGPKMYSPSPDLPFIVFHYPPLYHFVVRGLLTLGGDPLFTGRMVSVAGSVVSALAIGALILARSEARTVVDFGLAFTVATLFLCLPAVRTWGVYMRVDMLGIAFGLLGTAVFVLSRGSTTGTVAALLLCVAGVFTKQTQLPAGLAVFGVALVSAPRAAWIAAVVAGGAGLACAAGLEWATGGFLKNIIGYNLNPFKVADAAMKVWMQLESGGFLVVMLLGVAEVVVRFKREDGWTRLRGRDRRTIAESVVALHFILACGSGVAILKAGSADNYFIDLFASGCVLIGMTLCAALTRPLRLVSAALILAVSVANLSHRYFPQRQLEQSAAARERLVAQIAAASRPVSSDDMVLVIRAGKSLVFEPAIAQVLIAQGKWDPAPLLAMIRDHGFAFVLTFTTGSATGPLLEAAIHDAYPRREDFDGNLTGNYPP